MKKRMAIILCGLVFMNWCAAAITEQEARSIALEHAQLTEEEVAFSKRSRTGKTNAECMTLNLCTDWRSTITRSMRKRVKS